jgi:hypothetical protein
MNGSETSGSFSGAGSVQTHANTTPGTVRVGSARNSEYFLGSISNIQVYNSILTPFQVWQNFNAYKSRYGIPDIVTDGLVLNLDAGNPYSYLSGSSGTTWTNVAPVSSSISGSLQNGAFYSNGAITLDGVDDFVDCGTNSTTAIRGSSQFTLNYWFKKFSSGNDFLLGAWDQTASKGFFIQWFTNSTVYFGVSNGARSYNSVGLSYTSNWYNFTLVFDGTLTGATNIGKLYINGVSQSLTNVGGTATTLPTDVLSLYIGKLINYSSAGKGDIANLQIYSRALSQAEITQNFNALRGRYGI